MKEERTIHDDLDIIELTISPYVISIVNIISFSLLAMKVSNVFFTLAVPFIISGNLWYLGSLINRSYRRGLCQWYRSLCYSNMVVCVVSFLDTTGIYRFDAVDLHFYSYLLIFSISSVAIAGCLHKRHGYYKNKDKRFRGFASIISRFMRQGVMRQPRR